jgi:hypothetical protein
MLGQVGCALAACLAGRGLAVRAVSRHRPAGLAGGIRWRAAERAGALLVTLENLYGYGPVGGKPMTEDLPLAATTVKGRTRAAMTGELLAAAAAGRVRIAIGRAAHFFGAGVTEGSVLGRRVFGNTLAGRRADFIGRPELPHTYSYVAQAGAARPGAGQPDDAGAGRDGLPVRGVVHHRHHPVRGHLRAGRHAAGRRRGGDHRLVPDPSQRALTAPAGRIREYVLAFRDGR